ncbi:MAG: hypothetical protein OHK0038_15370 [Flammeovirgaceae bacterium]
MGQKYEIGDGVEKDINKALDYYKQSAEQGFSKAQLILGDWYAQGRVTPQNLRLSVKNYLKAANAGEVDAIKALNQFDLTGLADVESFDYLFFMSSKGDAESHYKLALLYFNGKNGAPLDEHKGREMMHKAALQDHIKSILFLGHLYEKGNHYVQQNLEESYKWFRKAAYLGNDSAAFYMGVAFEEAKGIEKDDKKAIQWYLKAANAGIKDAEERLSKYNILQFIKSSDLDYVTYRANRGDTDAILLLSKYYIKVGNDEALDWLKKLADKGNIEAYRLLGEIYLEGKCGLNKNYLEAAKWFEKAENQNDLPSIKQLALMYLDTLIGKENSQQLAQQKSIKYLENIKKSNPKSPDILLFTKILADISFRQKDFQSAILHYENYIKNYQDSLNTIKDLIQSLENKAFSYTQLNKWQNAAFELDAALSQLEAHQSEFGNLFSLKKGDLLLQRGLVSLKLVESKNENIFQACEYFQIAKSLGKAIPEEAKVKCMTGGN